MTTMVRLKNIKIGSEFAEADFYPEDSVTCGHIIINLNDGEVCSCTNVTGYGEAYPAFTRRRLKEMAKENDTRTECLVMWY